MIYLVAGYDLPFFWKGFFLQKEAFLTKFSLWMVEGYDLPLFGMVEGYDQPISKKPAEKIGFLQNYGGRI